MIELTDENTLYGENEKSEWKIVKPCKTTFVLCSPLNLILMNLLVFILTGNNWCWSIGSGSPCYCTCSCGYRVAVAAAAGKEAA